MPLPEELLVLTCDELVDLARLMKEAPDAAKALYYYSGAYGALDRLMKTSFDEDVFAAEFVTQTSYNALVGQLALNRSGDVVVVLTRDTMNGLADQIAALAKRLRDGKEIYPILRKIMLLTFVSTGPGAYLAERGRIKPSA